MFREDCLDRSSDWRQENQARDVRTEVPRRTARHRTPARRITAGFRAAAFPWARANHPDLAAREQQAHAATAALASDDVRTLLAALRAENSILVEMLAVYQKHCEQQLKRRTCDDPTCRARPTNPASGPRIKGNDL